MAFDSQSASEAGKKSKRTTDITSKLRDDLLKKFPEYNPVISLAVIANDEKNGIDIRVQAHKEVCRYIFPQLKAVETKDTSDNIRVYKVVYEDGGDNPAKTTAPESGEDTQGSEAV